MTDWRPEHSKTIYAFLDYLNQNSNDFILKGGTALLTCYKLDRFSEDIDLDGKNKGIEEIVKGFCDMYGFAYRIAKDTDTVKRYMVNYGNTGKPLKVEVSFRRKEIGTDETTRINGILVYNINTLCIMKTNAYASRDKIRDLYDVSFICNHYFNQLSSQTIALLRTAIEYKGIEQFDYIVREQQDELIDQGKLADDFLSMYDKLGLLYNEKEKTIVASLEKKTEIAATEPRSAADIFKAARDKAARINGDADRQQQQDKDKGQEIE